MWIAPEIVARHWEAAAAQQLARNLQSQGYEVSEREVIDGDVAGLVARRGGEVVVYGVKSPPWDERQSDEIVRLRDAAVGQLGARFKFVIVTPPRESAAEVDGLAGVLAGQLADPVPENLRALASRATVDDVSDVQVTSIAVRQAVVEVEGDAAVHVTLEWDKGQAVDRERHSFPLTFALQLGGGGQLLRVDRLRVDTASWYGPEEDEDDPAAPEPAREDAL